MKSLLLISFILLNINIFSQSKVESMTKEDIVSSYLTKKDIFFYSSDYFTKKMFDKQPYDKEKIKNTIEAMSFVKIDENNDRYRISTFTNNGDFVVLIFNITNVNCLNKTAEMRNYKEMNITQNLKNFSDGYLLNLDENYGNYIDRIIAQVNAKCRK